MRKLFNGEYLAPDVEVVVLNAQGVLCESDYTVSNPFSGQTEYEW